MYICKAPIEHWLLCVTVLLNCTDYTEHRAVSLRQLSFLLDSKRLSGLSVLVDIGDSVLR